MPATFVPTSIVPHDGRALVGGRVGDRPEIWFVDGALERAPFHPIPLPAGDLGEVDPKLAIFDRALAVTRVEYQGGSWGLVVFPDLTQNRTQDIPSPTDADLGFGQPLLIRGAEIFTQEGAGGPAELWHYRQRADSWKGQHIAIPAGLELDWGLALSADATRLAVEATRDGKNTLELFEREGTGDFVFARTLPLGAPPAEGLAFFDGKLVVGFPAAEHGDLTLVDPVSGNTIQKITVPPERSDGFVRVVPGLVVHHGLALVLQRRHVMVVDLQTARVSCSLDLAGGIRGEVPYPIATATQRHIFVATQAGRLGVFERSKCGG